jgi:hypothetical protein
MPGTEGDIGSKSLVLPSRRCSLLTRNRMSPRVSLDTSPRALRKAITYPDHRHPDDSFTSALDVPPPRPTALRRRGSDGDPPRYRDRSNHHAKYPSMDSSSPTEPHPLRRSSASTSTARTARYDTGSTRPRLSRVLSPNPPGVLAKSPPPEDFPLPDKAEPHRTVLAHEVQYPIDAHASFLLPGR